MGSTWRRHELRTPVGGPGPGADAVVRPGELGGPDGVAALRWALRTAVVSGARTVTVDMTDVPELSSTAVASLLNTHRLLRVRGGGVQLVNCGPAVLSLLHRTALWRVFMIDGEASAGR